MSVPVHEDDTATDDAPVAEPEDTEAEDSEPEETEPAKPAPTPGSFGGDAALVDEPDPWD